MEVLVLGLGCQGFWQAVEVYRIGRERLQAGMRTDGVVELDVLPDRGSGLMHRLVGVEIDLFILDGLPDPLDENIVAPSATTVPADGDAIFFEPPGGGLAGELAARP